MKKLAILLMIIALFFCSCQENNHANQKEEGTISSENPVSQDEIVQEKPPVSEELQILLENAEEVFCWFNLGTMNSEGEPIETNNNSYYLVTDKRFPTYESWYQYITLVFEKKYVDEKLLSREMYLNIDGKLYATAAARGSHIGYVSHKFELVNQTDSKIDLKVIGNYIDYNTEEEKTYTEDFDIIIEKIDGKWKVTQFELWY